MDSLRLVASPPSKILRTPEGRAVARVKRRSDIPALLAGPGALALIGALGTVSERRRRNAEAIAHIERQEKTLAQAKALLLNQRGELESATVTLLEQARLFLNKIGAMR